MTYLKIFPIQARWFLLLWFIPFVWDPAQLMFDIYLVSKLSHIYPDGRVPDYVFDFSFYYFNAARAVIVIAFFALITRTSLMRFVSPFDSKMLVPSLEITLFTFFASMALIYLTFYPMSFVVPEFINFWYINLPPIVYVKDEMFLFWPNILSFISLVILAPVTEEFIFRGILLQRWASKYNSRVAILLSSAIFASLHTDPLGAFLFGLLMCYLMVRSKGILLPMLCHAAYNAGVWGLSFIDHLIDINVVYTLADFKNEWVYAIIYIVISIFWAVRLQSRIPKLDRWKIPALYS